MTMNPTSLGAQRHENKLNPRRFLAYLETGEECGRVWRKRDGEEEGRMEGEVHLAIGEEPHL
jgi:hypothetical protein